MGILSGNPKNEPLHYGEIFGIWSYLQVAKGDIAGFQTLSNHTGDKDLHKLLDELTEGIKQEVKDLEEILKLNGIAIPPSPPERSYANLEDIPVGARVSDPEIMATISGKIAQGLVSCSGIIGQSIREDIGMLFGQYHMNKAQAGAKALRLSKTKGWLVPPPMHTKVPVHQNI
ncbi:hypothetical protein CEY16_06745 [Halalkalibacillus sediminis]|uniref:DUF3231 domain-containing protein n=1 Tax=Halalkalibacillus sediminis TaxID=2018042 RepID=A0A2I0QTJ2_9BACI|nr:DUF3231 family protein [Halalkalibacillus sediminis]PKR77629.1 hypothetical protein CEY16_06745 [Halalkalibacillus sediminis]